MWPDLAKFRHFGNILKALIKFAIVYLVFGQILNLHWQLFYAIGSIFEWNKWPSIEELIRLSGHTTVTEQVEKDLLSDWLEKN